MQTVPDFQLSEKIRKKILKFLAIQSTFVVLAVGAFCAYPL